jgi:putative DNA primase/helicase
MDNQTGRPATPPHENNDVPHRATNGHTAPEPPPDFTDDPGYRQSQEAPPDPDTELITEGGVAELFAQENRDRLRYDHDIGKWYIWVGTHWRRDKKKQAYHAAYKLAARLAATADEAKVIIVANRAAFAGGVEKLAQSNPILAVTSETWDADPWLLGTADGTIDLKTGILRPAQRSDFITKQTAVGSAETPDCPLWLAFLEQTCGGDQAYIRFLRQWFGYSLTGITTEQCLLFLHGDGGNGKGVLLHTIANIMGDYAKAAAMDTFIEAKGERHSTDLASLKGARLVTSAETEEGRAWSEVRINQLTGGDKISARFMRQDFFEFDTVCKITISGNHQPDLRNLNDAAKRRVNMGPCTHKPKVVDKELETKLRAEWPAILRWQIDGCLDWQQNGLIRPPIVTASTQEYFGSQDLLGQWIDEKCERIDQDGIPAKDTVHSLFSSYQNYLKARGEDPGSSKKFGATMRNRGFKPLHDELGIRGRGFQGIRVRIYFEP